MNEIVSMTVKNYTSELYGQNPRAAGQLGDGTLTVEQLQKDMISLKDELIRHAETVSEKATQRLVKEKSESEMLLEGRTQAFAVGLEKKYEEMFNLFKDDVLRQQGERNIRFNE